MKDFIKLMAILLGVVAVIGCGIVLMLIHSANQKQEDPKPHYITIQDDLYYVNGNIKILERERNPLEDHRHQYYLILHYNDGSRKTICFGKETERDAAYLKIRNVL